MSQVVSAPLAQNPPEDSSSSPFLPLLLVLFFGSGCAALIYEVVWYQMLELAIGSTSISVGVLLAAFMGGLCIGSIGLPRLRTQMHPLKMYALIEAGIAVFGLLVWLGVPLIDRVYIAANGVGLPNMLLRALVAAICLLPPTALMGASLPAAARWIESTRSGASWWGLLYGTNTIGAVFGSLLAGFYLLRMYGVGTATLAAVAINLVVAALSLVLAARTPARIEAGAAEQVPDVAEAAADGGRWFYLPDDCVLRRERLGRGSRLDAPDGHDAGLHGLRLLHHPRGLPDRPGNRFHRGRLDLAIGATAAGSGMVPDSADAGHRLERLHDRGFAAVLAHQSACSATAPGTFSSWIWRAACGRFCRRRSCGARVSRWHWPLWRAPAKIPRRWWEGSMPPTPWARS